MTNDVQDSAPRARRGRGRYAAWGVAGVGVAAAVGAGYFLYREKSVEKPRYNVVETDGEFEIRDYPELLVAQAQAVGPREHALDTGFGELADYIFAKSRPGGKIAMTAPVLSSEAGHGWQTRFVMPAHLTRENLPEPRTGVTIATLAARRVCAVTFNGPVDDDILAEREAQLRSWVGAKKLTITGAVEHAFYNSPMMPAGMRRNEVLLPVER